jgi:hypothetical protein
VGYFTTDGGFGMACGFLGLGSFENRMDGLD